MVSKNYLPPEEFKTLLMDKSRDNDGLDIMFFIMQTIKLPSKITYIAFKRIIEMIAIICTQHVRYFSIEWLWLIIVSIIPCVEMKQTLMHCRQTLWKCQLTSENHQFQVGIKKESQNDQKNFCPRCGNSFFSLVSPKVSFFGYVGLQ